MGMGTKPGQGTADALKWIAERHPRGTPVHEAALRAAASIEARLTRPALKKHISQIPLRRIFKLFKKPPPP